MLYALFMFFLIIFLCLIFVQPVAYYFKNVITRQKTFLDFLFNPVSSFLYRACGINPYDDQMWKAYLSSLLIFNGISILGLLLIFKIQHYLPFNEAGLEGPDFLACLHMSISYVTNTNWQAFLPEQSLSLFSQTFGVIVQFFLSPASAICVALVLMRSFKSNQQIHYDQTHPQADELQKYHERYLGNFWVDMIRVILWILLPLAFIISLILLACGVPQGMKTINLPDFKILLGPLASFESIKILGSNGGGFFNVNAAHPYENPSLISHVVQMFSMVFIPLVMLELFGRKINDRRHAWSIGITILTILGLSILLCIYLSSKTNIWGEYETRFGKISTQIFSVLTASTGVGASCIDHSTLPSFTQMMLILKMMIGPIDVGGAGSGFYLLISYVILAVFLAGLMVGRTPEYLGKKIEAREIRMIVIVLLIPPACILCFSAFLCWILTGTINSTAQELTQIIYAMTSVTSHNGSALGDHAFYRSPPALWSMSIAMLLSRYGIMSAILCIAGSFSEKLKVPRSTASFPLRGWLFCLLLAGTIIITNGLIYFPLLCLSYIPAVIKVFGTL